MLAAENIGREHLKEVERGQRFRFGRNWRRFLKLLDEPRIVRAESSLREFLEMGTLEGKTFLDVGSGSGLFSLAARRLGARVRSFDYDPESVACTRYLKERYFPNDTQWTVEPGSALDADYMASLGQYDVVYAWGVLHHTGDMWRALELVKLPVAPGGKLYIAIYNDSDEVSLQWLERKKRYCSLPGALRLPYAVKIWAPIEWESLRYHVRTGKIRQYFRIWRDYKFTSRGMSRWHDMMDWLGGYPYEFAKAQTLVDFYEKDVFRLTKLAENDGYGCHELVFRRVA